MSTTRQQRRILYEQLIGHTIADNYEIVRLMGFGGMGAVYEAIQQNMNRPIALKYIPSHDPVMAARFEREALTVSQLRHPNTVTVFDYGQTHDGFLFLTMEMLRGRTLTDVINDESPMAPHRVVHIASQICRSLAEAHRLGIVHRDVKPDNVILIEVDGDPDVVKVLDFGIAKAISGEDDVQLTGDGRIVGTPRYMSPEQILSESVDHRSDLYSLGCIIFEMLCGAPPFQGSSTTALMINHAQDAPPPFVERLTEDQLRQIPPALENVVRRAMAKSPVERQQDTDQLRQEMEEALLGIDKGPPVAFATPAGIAPGVGVAQHQTTPPARIQSPASLEPGDPEQARSETTSRLLLLGILIASLIVLSLVAFIFLSDKPDEPAGTIVEPLAQVDTPEPPSSAPSVLPEISLNETAHIRVVTEPDGARILDGNRILGTTPFNLSVALEDAGPLSLRLQADGHQDLDVTLDVAPRAGTTQEFAFSLDPSPRPAATPPPLRITPRAQRATSSRATSTDDREEPTDTEAERTTTNPVVHRLDDDSPNVIRLD